MNKITPEMLRVAATLADFASDARCTTDAATRERCDRLATLVARGLELAVTGEVDGLWFGQLVESCNEVLGYSAPAIEFGRLLGYHVKGL